MRFLRRTEETPHEAAGLPEENEGRKNGRRKRGAVRGRLPLPEVLILLLSLAALVMLGPLRDVLAPVPALLFLAAFALLMVPGLVLASALLGPNLLAGAAARVPVAFALSVGIFGLAALPELVLNKSIAFYPIICGAILLLSLGFVAVRIARWREKRTQEEERERSAIDLSTALLWVPFLLLAGVLAFISAMNVPRPAEDAWIYLYHVRGLLESGELGTGSSSRLALNGWLPEQAVLSMASGVDPVPMVLGYLAPALVVVALLALYTLVRTLLKSEKAALLIGSLSALLFVIDFGSASFESALAFGKELISYITEDKLVARYVFLPVALGLAILFMRERRLRLLGIFFFVCLSVAVVHPLGLAFIGICVFGFGIVHLAIKRRDRRAWWGVGELWLALFVITGPPALYLLATGSPLLFRLDAADPGVAANLIENWQYERRLLEVGEGSYIAHPSLLVDPGMLISYLLGVPFLIWKIKQEKEEGSSSSLAAQLLLGVLLFVPVLTFIPYTATLISSVIGPWMLYRLTWPLLLAALLTVGWMCWEVLRFVSNELPLLGGGSGLMRRVIPFLPLIVVGFLVVEAIPSALTAIRAANASGEIAQDESTCLGDPMFRWMQEAIPTSSRVMAPRLDSICINAYSASLKTLGTRGGMLPENQDQEAFYGAQTLGPDALQILQRRRVGYLLLPLNSPLNVQVEHLPELFTRMDNPGDKYHLYEVNQKALIEEEPTPAAVIEANGLFNEGEWDAAIQAYTEALEGNDPDERFLAYLGLGGTYMEKEQYARAAENYQAAVEIDPESSVAHDLLAQAYEAAGEEDRAQAEFERAIELDPENANLRLRYGMFLASSVDGDRRAAAVEQHQEVVKMYPRVPEYRVKLGAALLLAGASEAADEQFERALSLEPLSARLRADIAGANRATGRLQEALWHYEGALELEPNSQLYALSLGRVHALLSTRGGGRDEEHFEEAEALLKGVEELGHRPWEEDRREEARIALGDLYLQWDRPEEAAAAYERALELNPDSERAKEKLEELRQKR